MALPRDDENNSETRGEKKSSPPFMCVSSLCVFIFSIFHFLLWTKNDVFIQRDFLHYVLERLVLDLRKMTGDL
jgi:hypothetical protein